MDRDGETASEVSLRVVSTTVKQDGGFLRVAITRYPHCCSLKNGDVCWQWPFSHSQGCMHPHEFIRVQGWQWLGIFVIAAFWLAFLHLEVFFDHFVIDDFGLQLVLSCWPSVSCCSSERSLSR